MPGKVSDPKVRIGLDPTQFERGSQRVVLSWDEMNRAQRRAAQQMQRQLATHSAALRENEARTKQLAAAVAAAEERKRLAMERTGRAAMIGGAAVAAGIALATREAIAWESAWAGVRKTVGGDESMLAGLERDLRGLTAVLPASHEEIAAVAEAAGQLGVRAQDIAGFTRVMIDLGETTNLTSDEAATSIAQLMNIMQTAPGDVRNLASALVALGNDGASTERDIVQMAQRTAGAARTVGMSEADILAIANAVASVGVKVEAGGTAVSQVIIGIARAVADGGDDLREWARVAGMTSEEFAAAWRSKPAEAFAAVTTGLGQMRDAGANVFGILSDLDTDGARVTQTMLSLANAGDLFTRSLQTSSDAWQANNALAIEAGKRYDTAAAKAQMASNRIQDAGITLGQTFLPVVAAIADGTADVATSIGSLPRPLLEAAATFAAIAGAVAISGGAALLARQKWRAFSAELDLVAAKGTKARGAISGLGKAAGVALALGAVSSVAESIGTSMGKAATGVEATTKALLGAQHAGDLDALFTGLGIGADQVNGLDDAIARLVAPSNMDRFQDFGGTLRNVLGGGTTGRTVVIDELKQVGDALGNLVGEGRAEEAARGFGMIADRWTAAGGKLEDLRELMPGYTEALAAADNAQQLAADSADGLSQRYNAATGAMQELTDAQVEYLDAVAQSDAAMISMSDAYGAAVDDAKGAAQAQADAWNAEADAREEASRKRGISLDIDRKEWSDYYDGKTVTVDQYLAKLEQQVAAQSQWEQDLLTLAGRGVDQSTIDMLRGEGQGLAPVVHDLAGGTDEQLARLTSLAAQGGATASQEFADQLVSGTPVLAAAGDKLGSAAMSALVARLLEGKTTLQQIVDDYGLIVAGMPQTGSAPQVFGPAAPAPPSSTGPSPWLTPGARPMPAPSTGPSPWLAPGTPLPQRGALAPIQVIPVPVPIQAQTDASTNFYGPTTFTDPKAAATTTSRAKANTTGRRPINKGMF